MALTFQQWKNKFKGLLGDEASNASEAGAHAGQALERVVTYNLAFADPNTVSLSLPLAEAPSQSLREVVIHRMAHAGKLKSVHFCQNVSTNVSASASVAWNLLVQKRGGSFATASGTNTYSLTILIAGLTSCTSDNSLSGSHSGLTSNTARYPNVAMVQKGTGFGNGDGGGAHVLGKGDIITAQVKKGTAVGDTGAVFRGGTLILTFEEGT